MRRFVFVLVIALVLASVGGGVLVLAGDSNGGVYRGALPNREKVDRIVISKKKRRLWAYRGDVLLKTYRISIGGGGAGDKQYEGDKRTPVGSYRIVGRHRSKYHRFLGISYPNADDRKRYAKGRKAGTIPQGKGIGGAIGIHGEKRGYEWLPHSLVDWTHGCIAVSNDEIEELYATVQGNATVTIVP